MHARTSLISGHLTIKSEAPKDIVFGCRIPVALASAARHRARTFVGTVGTRTESHDEQFSPQ